jgi:hypothetical protein
MTLLLNKRSLLLAALAGTLALAACDNKSDLGPANNPANQTLKLSTIINMLVTTQTSDTAVPLEINALNIDTDSTDTALPNSDTNYSSLVGA